MDSEVKQTIISGQGELHLKVTTERLKRKFGIDILLEEPRVPYRETILSKGESKYRHKKQSGGAGQFAEVWMWIEPKQRGEGVEFTNSLVGQNVDRVFVPSVEKGVETACSEGILAGCKVVDLKIDFYEHVPVLTFRNIPLDDYANRFIKRIFDLSVIDVFPQVGKAACAASKAASTSFASDLATEQITSLLIGVTLSKYLPDLGSTNFPFI